MAPTKARLACQQASMALSDFAVVTDRLPSALNLYNVSDSGSSPGTYLIGEHRSQPLFMCVCHSALSRSPAIVLHCGPDDSFPPLGTAEWRIFSSSFYVDLPPLSSSAGTTPTRVEIKSVGHLLGPPAFRFSTEVGSRNILEHFEWRLSTEDAMKRLGGEPPGWELVRFASGSLRETEVDVATRVPAKDAVDGHEIVATWVRSCGNVAGKFRFVGTECVSLLGERWAIVALVTFCSMLERIRRSNPNLATAATAPPV